MATFWVRSGYGGNTRQPFVSLALPDGPVVQIGPDEARALADNLLQAAEAAEQDGWLVEWSMAELDLDPPRAANLLAEYRKWRERRSQQEA